MHGDRTRLAPVSARLAVREVTAVVVFVVSHRRVSNTFVAHRGVSPLGSSLGAHSGTFGSSRNRSPALGALRDNKQDRKKDRE